MSWTIQVRKKVAKAINKLPKNVREDLEALALVRGDGPNYSKFSDGSHHCHLSYSYVAIWIVIEKNVRLVEVTYVGSRENAPY